MIIFFYKGLTRNQEMGITPVWVSSNIWRLRQVRDTKFVTDVFNEMLQNARVTVFAVSDLLLPPTPTQVMVNRVKVILVCELMLKYTKHTPFKGANFSWFDSRYKQRTLK